MSAFCRGPRSDMRQTCKVCWHADRFDFHVDDETWRAVVPAALHGRVVCLSCFDEFASRKGIDYSRSLLPTLWFAGNVVSLKLRALSLPLLAQALVAELAGRRLRRLAVEVRSWPVRAVRAEMPCVGAFLTPAVVGTRHLVALLSRVLPGPGRREYRSADHSVDVTRRDAS